MGGDAALPKRCLISLSSAPRGSARRGLLAWSRRWSSRSPLWHATADPLTTDFQGFAWPGLRDARYGPPAARGVSAHRHVATAVTRATIAEPVNRIINVAGPEVAASPTPHSKWRGRGWSLPGRWPTRSRSWQVRMPSTCWPGWASVSPRRRSTRSRPNPASPRRRPIRFTDPPGNDGSGSRAGKSGPGLPSTSVHRRRCEKVGAIQASTTSRRCQCHPQRLPPWAPTGTRHTSPGTGS